MLVTMTRRHRCRYAHAGATGAGVRRGWSAMLSAPLCTLAGSILRCLVASGLVVPALTAIGCSSSTEPKHTVPPTLLVANATCLAGPCKTLEIRAFVWAFPVPQAVWGLEIVGEVHGATACLHFPASWTLRVETAGSTDTTFYKWTPSDTTGIYLFALDSALTYSGGTAAQRDSSSQALWPYDGVALGSVGHTATFVPGQSGGWSVTFPSKSQAGLQAPGLAVTSVCSP
jgi:hypothetical protein